jgi:hypothetical protein
MVDMANKLTLTSLLLFLPSSWQMAAGMFVVTCYIVSILYLTPYVRKGDDQLQLLGKLHHTYTYMRFLSLSHSR